MEELKQVSGSGHARQPVPPSHLAGLSCCHSSWNRQVAADDRTFTRGNHDGISAYPLQQVDKSQQMGFPSELEPAALFLASHKYLSSTWWKCQEQPAARNSCHQHKPGSRRALQTQRLNQRWFGQSLRGLPPCWEPGVTCSVSGFNKAPPLGGLWGH